MTTSPATHPKMPKASDGLALQKTTPRCCRRLHSEERRLWSCAGRAARRALGPLSGPLPHAPWTSRFTSLPLGCLLVCETRLWACGGDRNGTCKGTHTGPCSPKVTRKWGLPTEPPPATRDLCGSRPVCASVRACVLPCVNVCACLYCECVGVRVSCARLCCECTRVRECAGGHK